MWQEMENKAARSGVTVPMQIELDQGSGGTVIKDFESGKVIADMSGEKPPRSDY